MNKSTECLQVAPTLSEAVHDDKDDDSFWQQEELLAEQRDEISDFVFIPIESGQHYTSPTTTSSQTKLHSKTVFEYQPSQVIPLE